MSDQEPSVDGPKVEQPKPLWEDTLLMAEQSVPARFRHLLSPTMPPEPISDKKLTETADQILVKGGVVRFLRVDEYNDPGPGFPHASITLSFRSNNDPELIYEDINVSTPYPGNDGGSAFSRSMRADGKGKSFTQNEEGFVESRNAFLAKVKNLTKGK